jgi:uncharacterized phage infection (PIP) family protein YhgE
MSAQTTYRLLDFKELPPGSRLAAMYAAIESQYEATTPLNQKVNSLQQELEQVNAYLASATLENTTAEAFATATARQTLLERAIARASSLRDTAQSGYEVARANFKSAYDAYARDVARLAEEPDARDVARLKSGTNAWGNRLRYEERDEIVARIEERAAIAARIEEAIGV